MILMSEAQNMSVWTCSMKTENPATSKISTRFCRLIRDPNELGFLPIIPSWKAWYVYFNCDSAHVHILKL